jgi:hypothetical protein
MTKGTAMANAEDEIGKLIENRIAAMRRKDAEAAARASPTMP